MDNFQSEHSIKTGIYTKDQVKIREGKWDGGRFKRVFKVEIAGNIPSPAILKIPRVFQKDTNLPLTVTDKQDFNAEVGDMLRLKQFMPKHIPGYIGRYESGRASGVLVEEVTGATITDRKATIQALPTLEQWQRFEAAILDLVDKGIYVELDTLLLHNLMLGTLPGSNVKEVIMIEPRLVGSEDDNQMNRNLVLGALKSDRQILFGN